VRRSNLLAVFFLAFGTSLFALPYSAQANCVNTAQAETIAAVAEPTPAGETATVITLATCGGDDVSYRVPVTTTITYDGVQFDRVYATTNSVITFGRPDGTYWDYPRTPSISIQSMDWVVYPNQRNDEHLIISASDGGFQVDISARPIFLQSAPETTNIVITAAINTDGTVAISYVLSGADYSNYNWARTGARLNDGTVVPLEQANIERVEEAPVLTPEPVAPTPEPTPSPVPSQEPSPTPTPSVEPSVSPEPVPTQSPEPSPVPSPSQSVEPAPLPSPEPAPVPTPEPSAPSNPPLPEPLPTPIPEPVREPEPPSAEQIAAQQAAEQARVEAEIAAAKAEEEARIAEEAAKAAEQAALEAEIQAALNEAAPEGGEPPVLIVAEPEFTPQPPAPEPPAPPVEPLPPTPEPEPKPEPEVIPPAPKPEPTPEPEPVPVIPSQPEPPVVEPNPTPEPIALTEDTNLEELPADFPILLENGVVLTAEVVIAIQLLENPAELLNAIFTDPSQALMALSNIGADMSDEVREDSEKVVVSAIIAGGIATQAAASAAATAAYRRKP